MPKKPATVKPSEPVAAPATPTPEEKALSAKLVEELKMSEKKAEPVAAAAKPAEPAPAAAPVATTPAATPAAAPAEKPAAETPATPPKKKFGLPSFKLPFGKKPATVPAVADPAAAVTPTPVAEVVPTSSDGLAQVIDQKLTKMSSDDFIVIRISKTALLVLSGILLVGVWVVPVLTGAVKQFPHDFRDFKISLPKKPAPSPKAAASPAPTSIPLPVSKIQVRVGSNSLAFSSKVEAALTKAGFNALDVVFDKTVGSKTVTVATKPENAQLKQQLLTALSSEYRVSTESATLTTQEASFSATIFVGVNAQLGK